MPGPYKRILPNKERKGEWVKPALRELMSRLVRSKAGWPLLLHGQPGRGKTTAALWLLDFARTGVYATAREAIDANFSGWENWSEFKRRWQAADLCVLDQFGMSGKAGPGQTQAIVDLIDYREGRPLILVSNLTPDVLGDVYDGQIRSRIEGGTVVEVTGQDWRVASAIERASRPQATNGPPACFPVNA